MTMMMTMIPARRVRKERRVAVLLKVSETTNWIPHVYQHNSNRCSFVSLVGDDDDTRRALKSDKDKTKSDKDDSHDMRNESKWRNQMNIIMSFLPQGQQSVLLLSLMILQVSQISPSPTWLKSHTVSEATKWISKFIFYHKANSQFSCRQVRWWWWFYSK